MKEVSSFIHSSQIKLVISQCNVGLQGRLLNSEGKELQSRLFPHDNYEDDVDVVKEYFGFNEENSYKV